MKHLEWTKELDVGIAAMNSEHQRLIGLMNEFHRGVDTGLPREDSLRALTKLGAYTREHFASEEALMTRTAFRGSEEHARLHARLLEELEQHVEGFEQTGKARSLLLFMQLWLKSHIKGSDAEYGLHVNVGAPTAEAERAAATG